MKLSELRPCDNCGGPLAPPNVFYVVRMSLALILPGAVNTVLGMTQMFNGNLQLAEVMAPEADAAIIAGDEEPELMSEFILCQKCFTVGKVDLAVMQEKQNDRNTKDESDC